MKLLWNYLKSLALFALMISFSTAAVNAQNRKLIVIDPLVAGETENLVSQPPSLKVLRLPDKGNPISIITEELQTATYDEVHLYLLTKPGSIIFDELNILADNVQDFSADFAKWKTLLGQGARIVIHSETLTSVPEGSEIIGRIAAFTGRSVEVEQ